MAEDQPVKSACPHPEAVGTRWGDAISEERQAELKVLADSQREWAAQPEAVRGDSRFRSVPLSGAEVFWLAAYALAGPEGDIAAAQEELRPKDFPPILNLTALHLERAFLGSAHLEGANLWRAHLEGADLIRAPLEGAHLGLAHLEGADLWRAHLEGADLIEAHLEGANLVHAFLDNATNLESVTLSDRTNGVATLLRLLRRRRSYGSVSLADVRWNGMDLTVVDWSSLHRLGDERAERWWWRSRYEAEDALRANIQLAKQLDNAGLKDDADRFFYRAQVRRRGLHLLRFQLLRWLFSWLLYIVAGYGYRPIRTLFWYVAIVFTFSFLYLTFGHISGKPFGFDEALVFSVTSFHGRGFFPTGLSLTDIVTKFAATEAVLGLFIEISFIATFTQRFFAR